MPKKNENLANLKNSNNSPILAVESVESDKNSPLENDSEDELPLEVPKLNTQTEKKVREKKPQTEAQKAATAKMRQKLQEKWEKTRAEKAQQQEEFKKKVEEKVLKKAISIKKKQIKQERVLDIISDDETPMEEIAPLIKKKPVARAAYSQLVAQPTQPPKQRIVFI